MSNLRVSCHKIFVYLLFLLAIIFSCTDEDLFYDAVDQNTSEVLSTPGSFTPIIPDSIPEEQTDTTTVVETDTTTVVETDTTAINEENETPVAIAAATPSTGIVPLDVTFKGTHSTDDKAITSWTWNFKDGATSTAPNPSHSFKEVGAYDVELTVTDAEGLSSTDVVTINVNTIDNAVPVANAAATPQTGTLPLTVTFQGTGSSDDKAITSWTWNFKDGTTSTAPNPSHTFTEAGAYDVELTVTDAEGLTSTDTVTITVNNEDNAVPVANAIASPQSGTLPLTVSFQGTGSSDDKGITSWAWNFMNGATSTAPNPSQTFTEVGVYDVELTVTDAEGLTSTDIVTITVDTEANAAPVAKASATPQSGSLPLAVTFQGTGSSDDKAITSWTWNFKDGGTSTAPNPSHTFTEAGTYDAELTVTDAEGLSSTDTVTITVDAETNAAPVANASANPQSGTLPLAVTFQGTGSSDDKAITSWTWNFKDGGTSTAPNPSHTFTEAGTYDVELTVSDAEGLTSTDTVTITVNSESNEAPVAVVSADKLSGDAPLIVKFTGSNSTDDNSVASYAWNFKDGGNSTNANPTHTFNNAGSYSVELTVTDEDGLTDKASLTITVTEPQPQNEAPVAVANANPTSGDAPLNVTFQGTSSTDDKAITAYLWDFGNNDTSTAPNPSRTFTTPGVYSAQLTVTDAEGLTSTDSVTITVTQAPGNPGGSCNTDGGKAYESGLKTWCWGDMTLPNYSGKKGVSFSNGELTIDSECNENALSIENNKIKFYLNPTNPPVDKSWCERDFNMRAEFRTNPWNVNHPLGTEEWMGWSYTFGNDYKIDLNNKFYIFQVYPGPRGLGPQIHMEVIRNNQVSGHNAGELFVWRESSDNDKSRIPTGIVPSAGQTLNIVVHVVYGLGNQGRYRVWINGVSVADITGATVKVEAPWGGNAKWGIYKSAWSNASNVQNSANQGIHSLTTYMGNLRIITRKPGDANYGQNSYSQVEPEVN